MRLTHVVSACDLNPTYLGFVKFFIQAWKLLFPEVTIVVAIIAQEIPKKLLPYKDSLRLFQPIQGVPTAFQAQCIRLLIPGTLPDAEGVITSDIDMLPMNRKFYTDPIAQFKSKEDIFFSYRTNQPHPPSYERHLWMCYNIASGSTWRSIFWPSDVENEDETMRKILADWHAQKLGPYYIRRGRAWFTDQIKLTQAVRQWVEEGKGRFVAGKGGNFQRIRRAGGPVTGRHIEGVKKLLYSDYHMKHPSHAHQQTIERVVAALAEAVHSKI